MNPLDAARSVRNNARALGSRLRLDSLLSDIESSISGYLTGRWLNLQQRYQRTSRVGIYHRIVWSVPMDALADGWATAQGDQQDATEQLDADLRVEPALLEARAAARQDGGAWLWPVIDDDDWSSPLGEGPHTIRALHVLAESEVTALELEDDALSKQWARPSIVQVTIARDGLSQTITRMHASRLIYVSGSPNTPGQPTPKRGYDLPVLELYRQALDDYEAGTSKVGRLLNRLSMPWVKLKDGKAVSASAGQADYDERLQLLKDAMGGPGLGVLLGEDDVFWSGPSLAGIRDSINVLAERISSIEGLPLTWLLGQPPGGLSTDDASGKRAVHAVLGHERRLFLTPPLLELYEIALGPGTRKIVWPPLDKPTALEGAQISEAYARRDAALVQVGTIAPDESRARFDGGEELPLPALQKDTAPELPVVGEPQVPEPPEPSEDPPDAGAPEV